MNIKRIFELLFAVGLPLFCIGQFAFVIPKFTNIFAEMLGGAPLPKLTAVVTGINSYAWLILALAVVALDVYNVIKLKNAWITILSIVSCIAILGIVIIALFLPIIDITHHLTIAPLPQNQTLDTTLYSRCTFDNSLYTRTLSVRVSL